MPPPNQLEALSDCMSEAAVGALLSQKPFLETINGIPFVMLPDGDGSWKAESHEDSLSTPLRKKGTLVAHEVDSFIAFLKAHGSLATSNVYLNVDYLKSTIKAVAIFNDHNDKQGVPGYRDFRAEFSPRFSCEWETWTGKNKKVIEQMLFAHFLEENVADITKPENSKLPSGAEVLTFVSKLEEVRKVKYGNAVNLQNGLTQLEFTEDNDTATKGKLELFREFAIGISPFFGGSGYSIRAFLRYRIDRNTGEIAFWYELQRPDKVLEDATKDLIEKIKAEAGATVYFGLPGTNT